MILQPMGILIEDARVFKSVIHVVGEVDLVHAAVEGFFRRTKEKHFGFGPISNPVGNDLGGIWSGGIGSSLLCRDRETGQKEDCDHDENKSAFHRFLATSASVLDEPPIGEAVWDHRRPTRLLVAIQRHKRTTAIFHFCDASWELSDVTVPIQPLQLQGNGQALLSSTET